MAITWVYLLKMGIFHGELLNSQRVYVLSKLIDPVLGQFFDSFANPAAMKKGGSRVAAGLAGQPHQHPRSTMVYRIDFTCLIKNQGWSRIFFLEQNPLMGNTSLWIANQACYFPIFSSVNWFDMSGLVVLICLHFVRNHQLHIITWQKKTWPLNHTWRLQFFF